MTSSLVDIQFAESIVTWTMFIMFMSIFLLAAFMAGIVGYGHFQP